jgi:hypothetical protein
MDKYVVNAMTDAGPSFKDTFFSEALGMAIPAVPVSVPAVPGAAPAVPCAVPRAASAVPAVPAVLQGAQSQVKSYSPGGSFGNSAAGYPQEDRLKGQRRPAAFR